MDYERRYSREEFGICNSHCKTIQAFNKKLKKARQELSSD